MEKVENIEATVSKFCKEKQAKQDTTRSWDRQLPIKKQKIVAIVKQPCQDKQDSPIPPEFPLKKEQIVSLVKSWLEDRALK